MYGRGNYAPQFGQGLQRPMPPYQQQFAGNPLSAHLQPGNSIPMQSVIQQGGPPYGPTPRGPAPRGPTPHGPTPRGPAPNDPAYLHAPPPPRNMPHQGPLVSTSNTSNPYHHPPPTFLGAQQNFVPFSQNPQPSRPPTSSMGHRAPPPPLPLPPFMQFPPPLPPRDAAGFFPPEAGRQQSAEIQMPAVVLQPPPVPPSPPMAPPPPPSRSQTQSGLGGTQISDGDMSMEQSVLVGLPPAPPKPADEKVVRNIELLCQFIVKNGPEFEEMARKKEHGNPEFNFLVGGNPGSEAASAHEYFLWMKNKCTIENGLHKYQGQSDLLQKNIDVEPFSGPNSLPNLGTAHSPADSDVDMEDDITQSDKEHGAYKSVEDTEQEPIATNASEMQKQESKNELQDLNNNGSALKPSQSVKDGAESEHENPVGEPVNVHSPFRLIQNYASDDSSDDGGEQCLEKNVTTFSESGLTKDQDNLHAIQGDLQEDDLIGRTEGSNAKIANTASDGKYVSGSSGVYSAATHKDVEKGDEKNSQSAVKDDEFGRLVKEGASESESDDSHHSRKRGRRDRSRSCSRSPSEWRSPHRRKERRSRSRSWSPKSRRSRSRSPYRPGGDFPNEKLREGKIQTPECFDFIKGRCSRGASCRYLHPEVDKDNNSRRYNSKQHHVEDKLDSRDLSTQTFDERNIAKGIDDASWPSVSHQDVEKLSADVKNIVDSGKDVQVSDASDKPVSHLPISDDQLSSRLPLTNELAMNHPKAEGSVGDLFKKDDSSQIESSHVHTSTISSSGLSTNEPCLNKTSSELPDFSVQVSRLPTPILPQQASNPPKNSNLLGDYNYMPPTGSLPPQSIPIESGPLYRAPLPNQQSHYPILANPAWSAPSQPRPPHMVGPPILGNPLQFQHGNFPLRNDFPGQSHAVGFSHQTHHLPSSNIPAQPFAGSNLARDDRYPRLPTQTGVPLSSFVPGVPQPVPVHGDSTVKSTQSVPGDNVLVGDPSKSSFQNHQLVPGYSSNVGDRDNSSSFFDVGGTRISSHYNPYASTFDQPLSTRFSSIAFSQGREASTGVQYDPLFDSLDPKLAQKQDHAADNSDIILKLSNHHNVLDVEENNKQKMVGPIASSATPENDEFGETADAEVGAVENGSPSDPNDDADIADGDIEIDQVKPEGRSKKSKDSRSMKLFKIAVANFVKDILKPHWRQGNMSKEVFKTIVKKTVDKVSGAMKNHRLPKSQAKIDHYIDSSRRKLTQLVEGYVSKYKN